MQTNLMIRKSLTALLLIWGLAVNAQTVKISGELKKWHKVTLDFNGPASSETGTPNPFMDYRLNVTFTKGSKSYVVPGYFAADGDAAETSATSGNVWRCHFAPDETGTWSYKASFRQGSNIAVNSNAGAGTSVSFDGASGTFSISATDKSGPDLRGKGLLRYVGRRYLQFAETGEYFLKGGADAPENLLAYEDFDNTPNNGNHRKSWSAHLTHWKNGDPDWQGTKGRDLIGAVNYLSSKGMNAFSMLTMNIAGDDKNVYPYVEYNDKASPQDDRLRFDVSKLAQWEIVFEHADKKGMFLHFKTQETENDQLLDGAELGNERKLYYREMVARFSHHLALNWNLGEENDIWTEKNDPNQNRVKSYAKYFKDIDPYDHHIVIHSYSSQQDDVYMPLLGDVDFNGPSIQTGRARVHDDTQKWVDLATASGVNWVVTNDEQNPPNYGVPPDPGYPGYNSSIGPSQAKIREDVLWGNLMAGGGGVEYYFGYEHPQSDLTCEDWTARDQMWDYTRHALEFFQNHIPFQDMYHNDGLVSGGYCLAKEGDIYAVYIPPGASTPTLDLTAGNYNISWYNPLEGGALESGGSVSGGLNRNLGNPPSNPSQDWVVLVVNENFTTGFLPVELLRFEAQSNGFEVSLAWETAHEQNSDVFEVERSLDGADFDQIGMVYASGNSDQRRSYLFVDENPISSKLYYRLKMVDLDGQYEYSNIETIEFTPAPLKVRPVPTDGEIFLDFSESWVQENQGMSVRIIDLAGRVIYESALQTGQISLPFSIDLSFQPSGIYFLQCIQEDEILLKRKLIKI
ncbi:MAG: DUF5060 domain-containing protein [Bacteroidetes bacterium]|nr:DUF5060 domain-containing protein [Bacteroidota bacterium]